MSTNKVLNNNELKPGDTIKCKQAGYSNYGLNIGDMLTITQADLTTSKSGGNPANYWIKEKNVWIALSYFEKACFTQKEIEAEIEILEKDISSKKSMVRWMKATKSEKYDEVEFKVWNTLELLDSNSSQIDKARAIAALIKGC